MTAGDWSLSRRQLHVLLIVGVVIGAIAVPVLGAYLDNSAETSGTIPLNSSNGLLVNVSDHGGQMNLTEPFPNASAVQVQSANGNATFVANSEAAVTVDEINGVWTNVSQLDVNRTWVTIYPEDKQAVAVEGDTDTLNFTQIDTRDTAVDIKYSGASGETNLTLYGVTEDRQYRAVENGIAYAANTSTADGVLVFHNLSNSDHSLSVQTSEGGPSLSNPAPEGVQNDFPTTLSVNVTDPDFDTGDNVTVEFYHDGTLVGTNTTNESGEVSVSISKPSRGSHTVKASATDLNGNEQNLSWSFGTPNNLTVREATKPHNVIDDRDVTFTFYQNGNIERRTTSNGTMPLEGLATDTNIVASVKASGYNNITIVIEDLSQQDDVYLLNTSETSVEVLFTLQDRTGNFDGNGAKLFIQRPINLSSGKEWDSIHAEEFGPAGVQTTLEEGQRYRLIVKNDGDDSRVLGTYVADQAETVPLTVGTVTAAPSAPNSSFAYNASYINNSNGQPYVYFEFNDTNGETDQVTVRIYEYGNESNALLENQTFSGPLGTFALTEAVPADETEESWVVEFYTQRSPIKKGSTVVGPRSPALVNIPDWLAATISVGSIILVAGLFSQFNGKWGGVTVAGMGGFFWFADFLPQEVGAGVVALAMIVAGVIFLQERRGA
jgi:hypothetical protein